MPPTAANLRFIAGCATVAEALAQADAAGPPPRIEPRDPARRRGRTVGMVGIPPTDLG